MRHLLLTIGLFFSISSYLLAQSPSFVARAPQAVTTGDKFQLVYTLNTEGSDIRLAPLEDFQIIMGPSTSYSNSTSIVNGKVTRETTYTFIFVLKPLKVGTFQIPPASITVDGKKINSNAVSVEVIEGQASSGQSQSSGTESAAAASTSADDLFITVTPSKRDVYMNESLVITTKIYTSVQLDGISDIKQPELTSFLTQELKQQEGINWSMENVNGRTYNVGTYEQKLLFPLKTGKLTIDATSIEFLVRQRTARQGRSIFDDFFESSHRSVKKTVKSQPISINVKPLPGNKPAGFSGGVGKLDMQTSISSNDVTVNDGVTVKVTIGGTGNHKYIEDPVVKFPADFDTFDPKVNNASITPTVAGLKGNKTYEYLIIPRHAGTFTIPAIRFSYFDPSSGDYKTISSGDMVINVAKGEGSEGDGSMVRSNVTRENVKFIGKDIRYIKTDNGSLKPAGTFLFGSLTFYSALFIPLLSLILLFLINQKRIRENADIAGMKTKKANKMAKKRLKLSAQLLKEGKKEAFYEELLRAMWGYMSDKLSLPLSELSKDNINDLLLKSSVPAETVSEVLDIMDTCEFARYAPAAGSGEMDKVYQKTMASISKLENQIKRK